MQQTTKHTHNSTVYYDTQTLLCCSSSPVERLSSPQQALYETGQCLHSFGPPPPGSPPLIHTKDSRTTREQYSAHLKTLPMQQSTKHPHNRTVRCTSPAIHPNTSSPVQCHVPYLSRLCMRPANTQQPQQSTPTTAQCTTMLCCKSCPCPVPHLSRPSMRPASASTASTAPGSPAWSARPASSERRSLSRRTARKLLRDAPSGHASRNEPPPAAAAAPASAAPAAAAAAAGPGSAAAAAAAPGGAVVK
jgi:hypothetical protein